MRRLAFLGSVVAVVLLGLLAAGHAATTVAQEGTPPAEEDEQPEGVTFEALAFGLAEELPPGPTGLALFRATLEPGARIDLDPDPGYFMVAVQSGAITFRVDTPVLVTRGVAGEPAAQEQGPEAAAEEVAAGTDVALEQGDAALFPPNPEGTAGEARNDGQERAVVVVVSAGPAESGGARVREEAAATPVP